MVVSKFQFTNENDNETLIEAERLIRRYVGAREALRDLGVIRTERNLEGDYAEWVVSRMLNLDLSESGRERHRRTEPPRQDLPDQVKTCR